MQSTFLQVLFSLSWLLSSHAQVDVGSGLSCVRSSPADVDGQTRITFLRDDPAGLRSLYLTLWSGDMRLQACEVNRSPVATERYRTLCDRSGSQGQETTRSFNSSALLALDASCAPVSSSAPKFPGRSDRDGTEGNARRKRSLVMPGTLWCGRGNDAARYEQLGMFEDTDRCCRDHDHCLHVIYSFTVKYGVFNSNFYTVSHCDCDQRFRQCLQEVNDTVSSMVGYSFFNILQVPCFELKYQKRCTQMYWWGMCKVAKPAPYAVFKKPLPFNTSDVTSKYNSGGGGVKQHVTKGPVISPRKKLPKTEHRCGPRDPPRGDTFVRSGTRRKGCKRQQKVSTVAVSPVPPTPRTRTTTPPAVRLNPSKNQALISTKQKVGKKKHMRKGLLAYTQKSHVSLQDIINLSSTTESTPLFTQRPTAITTKTAKRNKKAKQSGFRMPVRDFGPHCKSCLEQTTTSRMTTVTTATATNGLLVKVTMPPVPQLRNTTQTPRQDTLKRHWSTATFSTPITTKLKTATSLHKDSKPHKQRDAQQIGGNKAQESMGGTTAQSIKERRILKAKNALRNMTDNQLLCESLKHLDECKYQIPPLEKRYHLQNTESKTSYHCDCTSRLAAKIKRFKQPSVLPTLLMDFVSPHCFKLLGEKKCHNKKSCSGSFSKALDLLGALKKIEEKDTAWVRNSGNDRKRGIPVRLYKRCLRLEREADMAQLR